jgi:trimethylamine:corrinoid methyltransferase-like protein
VIDALNGLDMCPNPTLCSDVPGKAAMLHSLEAMLAHTRKPVSLTVLGGAEELDIMLKMCKAAVGEEGSRERPFLTIFIAHSMGLQWSKRTYPYRLSKK